MFPCLKLCCWTDKERPAVIIISTHMERASQPAAQFEVDVDLGFALFFLFLLCFFLLVTVVRCAQTVVDPYGSISTSTYQEEQITWGTLKDSVGNNLSKLEAWTNKVYITYESKGTNEQFGFYWLFLCVNLFGYVQVKCFIFYINISYKCWYI